MVDRFMADASLRLCCQSSGIAEDMANLARFKVLRNVVFHVRFAFIGGNVSQIAWLEGN